MILDRINEPKDLKTLTVAEMKDLASEIREAIINKVNTIGGHMGPNLGIVETTIAMHYVFDSPVDKIVYDVAHQCYPHKILTGRKDGFLDKNQYLKYTGFTAPEESAHDLFKVGHTSTAVSLATGVAKSRDLKGETGNVIALVGDGSITGGEALEGLNNASVLGSNIIIILNDNDMSIAENHGGLYDNLKLLRETEGKAELNFFKTMGFDYKFVKDGNDIEAMIKALEEIKDVNHPVLLHICTKKGLGLKPAEENKEIFHWVMPGVLDEKPAVAPVDTYASITTEYMLKKAQEDKTFIAVNAATPGVFGFTREFREKMGKQYTDVGIAEEHAVAYCSAMAKCGAKPVLSIMSSFVQRTYDQLSQDLCLNSSPLTILVHWSGISGADCTHLCTFDVSMISNIPNLVYLAPTNKEEYLRMLDWSVEQNERPVVIRVPQGGLVETGIEDTTDYSKLNRYSLVEYGERVALIGMGNMFSLAQEAAKEIEYELGFKPTVINPKFLTGIDEDMLDTLKRNHELVVTLEDGILNGGFGEKIARFYGPSQMKVYCLGGLKEFTDRISAKELYNKYHLTKEQIAEDVKKILG